jgi:hypothetical protein
MTRTRLSARTTEGRRYLGLDVLARSRITLAPGTPEVISDNDLQALSA